MALVPSVVVGDEPSAVVANTSTELVGTSSAPVPSVGVMGGEPPHSDHDVDMRTEIDLTLSDAGNTARADSMDRLSTIPLSPGAHAVAVGAQAARNARIMIYSGWHHSIQLYL